MITITQKHNKVIIRKMHADGPNHTHPIEASNIRKTAGKIVDFVKEEAKKKYRAPEIKHATTGIFENKQIGVEHLNTKEIINVQHQIIGGLNSPFIGASSLEEDLKDSMEWLKSNNYSFEIINIPNYRGLAFATVTNLNALRCTGVLCVVWVFRARESKTPQGNLAKVYQTRLNQPIEIEIYATLPIITLRNSITQTNSKNFHSSFI